MALDDQFMRQLLDAFRAEMEERVQEITDCLLALEKSTAGEDRRKLFEALFRGAHSLKGAAQSVDLDQIADIAHRLESLFGKLKRTGDVPHGTVVNLSLEALDRMQECLVQADGGPAVEFDLADLFGRLDGADGGSAAPPTVATAAKPDTTPDRPVTAERPADDDRSAGDDRPAAVPEAVNAAEAADEADSPTSPHRSAAAESIRVSVAKLDAIVRQVEALQITKNEISDHLEALGKIRDSMHGLVRTWQHGLQRLETSPNGNAAPDTGQPHQKARAVRILEEEVADLYRRMRATAHDFANAAGTLRDDSQLIRLIPVSTLLRPLSRTVRSIAEEMGKSVEFVTAGDSIEMDRRVLDNLRDPLTHLIRNACDHGIEAPEQRSRLGKAESGRISVEVTRTGSRVTLLVRDDGAGIDLNAIAEIAVRKRLIGADEVASRNPGEILNLIFSPGFSSKEIITSISGRGVGLDVVQDNLRHIGGSVSVETNEGQGTTFRLLLPVALLSDRGLLVTAGGTKFAIPSTAIDRLLPADPDQFVDVAGFQMVLFQERPIPVATLEDVLELDVDRSAPQTGTIAVMSAGRETAAVIVDDVVGEREMVVKPFATPLVSVRNVAGATVLSGGELVPVLDPEDLVDSARTRGARVRVIDGGESTQPEFGRQRILVVDDSITTRMLERTILETNGFEVEVALDGRDGWERIQRNSFDLVVSDVEMPVMDGFELTRRIKETADLAQMPVVLVTSLSRESDKQKGIEVGADAYIVKGQFETRVLLDVVTQLL